MNPDPRNSLLSGSMSRLQLIAVALTVCLNGLDGFDVQAISFAAPGIAEVWGINRAALGIVLSMELAGMGMGSMAIGSLADRFGRRPVILGCLTLMTCGMGMAATSSGIVQLAGWRLLTGLGIGGMLSAISAVAAEFSNARRRNLCVSLMAIGFPLGAVIGGYFSSLLLQHHAWPSIFWLGAGATAAFLPLVFLYLPESVPWLCHRQPPGALEKINGTFKRMGQAAIPGLPELAPTGRKISMADIFAPGLAAATVLMTVAFFLHMTTFYFILKWVPKIVVDMGFAPAAAAGVLVWANLGGATGGAVLGLVASRYGAKPLTIAALLISTLMVAVFGRGQADLLQLSAVCAVTGFFTNAGAVGLYALVAQVFPTPARGFGTGFVIGIGRGGTAIAPVIAGYLFTAGYGLQQVAVTMSVGSLVAAAALMRLHLPRP